jgi:hypothetical protein
MTIKLAHLAGSRNQTTAARALNRRLDTRTGGLKSETSNLKLETHRQQSGGRFPHLYAFQCGNPYGYQDFSKFLIN